VASTFSFPFGPQNPALNLSRNKNSTNSWWRRNSQWSGQHCCFYYYHALLLTSAGRAEWGSQQSWRVCCPWRSEKTWGWKSHHVVWNNDCYLKKGLSQGQQLKLVLPTTWELGNERQQFKASLGRKFRRFHLKQLLDTVVHACHPKLHWETHIGESWWSRMTWA
jgi:hypothetical protein